MSLSPADLWKNKKINVPKKHVPTGIKGESYESKKININIVNNDNICANTIQRISKR